MSILKDIIDALEDRQVLLIATVLYTVNDEKQASKVFDFVRTETGIDISKVGNIYRLTDAEVDKLKNFEIDSHDKLLQIIAQMDNHYVTEKKDMAEFVKFYSGIKFKCTNIEYNSKKRVKYMLLEQQTSD